MSAFGIQSISLSTATEDQANNNNVIIKNGSFQTTSGATDNISEVYLQFNPQAVSSTLAVPTSAYYGSTVVTGSGSGSTFQLASNNQVDVVRNTSANLNNSNLYSFTSLDQIDLTDMAYGNGPALSFTEDPSKSFGTLNVSNGSHSVSMELFGQFLAAGFQESSDNGSGTTIVYVPPQQNYAVLATGH